MKIKDLISLNGCYSAHDVGEKETEEVNRNDFLLTISPCHSGNVEEACKIYRALKEKFIILKKAR